MSQCAKTSNTQAQSLLELHCIAAEVVASLISGHEYEFVTCMYVAEKDKKVQLICHNLTLLDSYNVLSRYK